MASRLHVRCFTGAYLVLPPTIAVAKIKQSDNEFHGGTGSSLCISLVENDNQCDRTMCFDKNASRDNHFPQEQYKE